MEAPENEDESSAASDTDRDDEGRLVDFRAARGEAGHETEDMGWEDVPDTGGVARTEDEDDAYDVEAVVDDIVEYTGPD